MVEILAVFLLFIYIHAVLYTLYVYKKKHDLR